MVHRSALLTAAVVVSLLGFTGCGSTAASQGKVICPNTDKYGCYFQGTDWPVRGPRTISGYKVVGVLPAYCTQRSGLCTDEGVVSSYYPIDWAPGSHPDGEYLEWRIRGAGHDTMLATYVTVAEEQSHNFGRLPAGSRESPSE